MHDASYPRILVILMGLIVSPLAWASTYESWTDGFYDAELNNDILGLLSLQAVIDDVTVTEGPCIEIVAVVPCPAVAVPVMAAHRFPRPTRSVTVRLRLAGRDVT